ncbi:MAG TPA: hypothetical protein VH482_18510 [Thermomicrobiales bacterium]|jgi:hypothetical protein
MVQTLFRPHFLGDKYPNIDVIVELVGAPVTFTPLFFAQIKATERGLTPGGHLPVQVTADALNRLTAYPVPTYIIGVDNTRRGVSYIVAAVAGGPAYFRSLPTTHRLNATTRKQLFDEVLDFWRQHPASFAASRFV